MLTVATMTTLLLMLAGIFVAHYVGDFVLQSRWMGENKSKKWAPLLVHIGVYTLVLAIFSMLILGPVVGIIYAVVNGLLHMVTDYISSRLSSAAYKEGNLGRFWMIIGADQMVHQLCLVLTLIPFLI